MAAITEHRNAHLDDNNMHEVKGFTGASNGYAYKRSINGRSEWQRVFRQENVTAVTTGYEAPPTETDLVSYVIESPELDVNAITYQSGGGGADSVRFTFSAGYDSTLYSVGSYLQVSGAANSKHNGQFVIITVNASYLEVTIADVTDASDDVASGSTATAYVTHEDYDPENEANGNTIPRVGIVKYYSDTDLWYGDAFEQGDEFFNVATLKKHFFNGTELIEEGGLITTSLSLTTAQLKSGTGVEIVSAQGVGYLVEPISALCKYTHDTVDYNVGSDILIYTDTGSTNLFTTPVDGSANGVLQATASSFSKFINVSNALGSQFVENKAIYVKADGVSASGDGTAIIYLTYRIIKI
jgi:hypothetical protein